MNHQEINRCKQILTEYSIGDLVQFEPISVGYANLNFKLYTTQGTYLYRICTQQERSGVLFEINLLNKLKEINFPTAYIIRKANKELFTETPDGDIMIYEFINGSEPTINSEIVSKIGDTIARLNSVSGWKDLPKENAITILKARNLIETFSTSKNDLPEIYTFFKNEADYLFKPLQIPLRKSFVHGDAFADNTLFSGNKLNAIIDFEEACVDHSLFDIGITINGFCISNNTLDFNLLESFLTAYSKIRPLSENEFELLHYYIHWGAFAMVYWHLKNDLRNKHNQKQLERVIELIDRIKNYHAINSDIKHRIKSIEMKVTEHETH